DFIVNIYANSDYNLLFLHDALPISTRVNIPPTSRSSAKRWRQHFGLAKMRLAVAFDITIGKARSKSLASPATSKRSPSVKRQSRSEEPTSELQSPDHLVCRLLLEKK